VNIDPKLVTTILVAALVVWGIARRVRRTFGRQPVQVARIGFRIGVLAIAGVLIVATTRNTQAFEAVTAGIACGAALGYLGLQHTRFEVTPEGRFYTPHTYIGLAVTALFLGRLVYRFVYLSYGTGTTVNANQNLAVAYQKNPVTLGIFGVLVGYYVLFYSGVLVRTRTATSGMGNDSSPGI
jgi:hypothetical protein